MRNHCVFAALSVMSFTQSFAQTENSRIPKIIPPSPNAAALEKFSSIPVDYSTGVPSISYPMWGWQRGKLQFSLGLSYHAGGHKVDDMASNVGLGWTTSGLWKVSRTVKSLPDELPVNGFVNSSALPQVATNSYNGDNYYNTSQIIADQTNFDPEIAITPLNSANSPLVKAIAESETDGEQDVFSYSINGASGKFIINKSGEIIPLEHTNNKIEIIPDPSAPPGVFTIDHFDITDDKGIIYRFEYEEEQTSETESTPVSFPGLPPQTAVSSWLLTKILDPSTQDYIEITYTKNDNLHNCLYETGFSSSQQIPIDATGTSLGTPSYSSSYTLITGHEPRPTAIAFPDGSSVEFTYGFDRDDYINTKALTQVVVKNYLNETIKKFQLDYSYFTASSGSTWTLSGNDNSKRLRLNSVTDVASDDVQTKTTTFTYNSTALNPRGSSNVDYWGNNVNPARNNFSRAPTIPLSAGDQVLFGEFLSGSDLSPDETYSKAAVLEKIQYPTGGFVSFQYECNKAFSELDYYVNTYETNTGNWRQGTFNQNVLLSIPEERVEEAIDFYIRLEDDPTGTPQDNDPPTCFGEAQDPKILRFELTGTGGYSTFFEKTYQSLNVPLDVKVTVNLPLGQNYRLKLVYDANAACSFLHPFKVSAKGVFVIKPEDKLAGGLRIKKIVANDGSRDVLTKEYSYNAEDGHSSAQLNSPRGIPNFGYYKTTLTSNAIGSTPTKSLNRSSNPTVTLNFNGTPLIYARVIEKDLDNSTTERQYDPLITIGSGGDPEEYPFMPVQDFPNLSGLLKKTILRDNTNAIKKEQTITYNKVQTRLTDAGNRNLKTGTIATSSGFNAKYYVVDYYSMYTSRAEITSEETVENENGLTMTTTVDKTYQPTTHYLLTEESENSKEEIRKKTYKYAHQGSGSVYTEMITKNMLSYPIEEKLEKIVGVTTMELSRTITNFQLFQSGALPMAGTIQSSLLANTPETDITFDSYDDKGNITQYTAKDGVVTSFVWGYSQQYPVAKIIGKTYPDAISQSGLSLSVVNAPSSDAAMRTELNKLRTLVGCQVSTLTYKPLIGTTSETDINGRTVYYEYDAFGRLNYIKDHDQNILKRFCYNYAGQLENCN